MLLRRCNRWALIVDTKNLSNNRHSKKKFFNFFVVPPPLMLFFVCLHFQLFVYNYRLWIIFFVCIHILIYVRTTTKNYKQTAVMYKLLPCLVITLFERKSCLQKNLSIKIHFWLRIEMFTWYTDGFFLSLDFWQFILAKFGHFLFRTSYKYESL